jgi:CO/xanthine dehydrogenase FAD-binding subunit
MIPFDFDYYKPDSLHSAISLYQTLYMAGKKPIYYSGGTEFITFARIHQLYAGAVIDIKAVPQCQFFHFDGQKLTIGSANTLSQLSDSNAFPLLGAVSNGIADRTSRNKITLGGNINSKLIFREAILPLLLSNSQIILAGPSGVRSMSINQVFNKSLQLERGEIAVQFIVDAGYLDAPFFVAKSRKQGEMGYPLLTIAAMKFNGRIRVAFSTVCEFPFRSAQIEADLNDRNVPLSLRMERAISHLPGPIISNIEASAAYRQFVLRQTLKEMLEQLEEA